MFELESGGDVRCFIIDNHRPIHLSNIHSRHNVVVFEDETSILLDEALIPDDGSDLSDADEDSSDEEQEDIDDVEDEGDGDEDEREEIINKEDIQNAFGDQHLHRRQDPRPPQRHYQRGQWHRLHRRRQCLHANGGPGQHQFAGHD